MKSTTRFLIVAGCASLLIGLFSMAPTNAASIVGSKHDFGATGAAGQGNGLNTNASPTGDVCSTCHVPHNAATAVPLWDHDSATSGGYTLYTSTTLNGTATQPAGVSLMCLSCHDGSVAIDAFGGGASSATMTGAALVGTDLSNDHPVSINYDTADTGLVNNGGAPTSLPLYAGNVECASCHNVHDPANGAFLRLANTGSALCLDCHVK